MPTITINVSDDILSELKELLEKKRAQVIAELAAIDGQLAAIDSFPRKTQLEITEPGKSEQAHQAANFREMVTRAVLTVLRRVGDAGIGIAGIQRSAGTSYSSTYRVLRELEDTGKVERFDGKWKLKPE